MARLSGIAGESIFALLFVFLSVISISAADGKPVIRVKGSNDTAAHLDALAKRYQADHPNVNIVVSGGGTVSGFEGLLEGTVEVVMASSRLTETQKLTAKNRGLRIREHFFGWQGIAVFVHPRNEVTSLSLGRLRDIFSGKSTSWPKAMGPAKPVTVYIGQYPFSDAYKYFQNYVLARKAFRKDAVKMRYYRNIVKAVSIDRFGIGLATLPKAIQARKKHPVKLLGVNKTKDAHPVFPTNTSVEDRSYPLIRPLYLYTDSKSDKTFVSDFVEYCTIHGLPGKGTHRRE